MLTEIKEVIVEEKLYSGSAFGVTEEGDGVFFNARIVDKVGLKGGQTVQAYLVPNYPDKRADFPWRAMRVHSVSKEEKLVEVPTGMEKLKKRLHRLLDEDQGFWTLSELCDEVDAPTEVVRKLLDADKSILSTTAYYK